MFYLSVFVIFEAFDWSGLNRAVSCIMDIYGLTQNEKHLIKMNLLSSFKK